MLLEEFLEEHKIYNMKTLTESIIGRKNAQSRPIWYNKYNKEPKLSRDEIIGDIEDCIGNVRDNNNYLRGLKDPEVNYAGYVADVLNIAARCKDKKISDTAKKYLHNSPDEELFDGVIAISQLLGI